MLESFVEQNTHPATPTPTPGPWTTYRNDDYGYSIDIAPGWYQEEETDEDNITFWSEEGHGILEIVFLDLGRDFNLDELAELWRDALEETAREDSSHLFEITSLQKRKDGAREYYHLSYRLQESTEYCVLDGIARIMLSDFYPSKPFGFAVFGSVCEHSLDLYSEQRDAMLASFDP